MHRFLHAAAIAALLLAPAQAALAQQGPGWFIPNQPHAAAPAHPRPAPGPRAAAAPAAPAIPAPIPQVVPEPAPEAPPVTSAQLPPIPQLPALPKGTAPPTPVIGVLGVPEVMRASTAAQEVEKVIGGRREKLAQDAQKEQAGWREMQQQIAGQRSHLSAEQLRTREKALQDRIANAQNDFRQRNQVIQQAAQVGLGQIERTLIAVIRQVAESRGMNLVLHRAQVALNVNEFDITQQVTDQLNKILPSVTIPPEGAAPQAEQGSGKAAEAAKEEPAKAEAAKTEAAKAEPAKADAKKTPPSPKKH